MHKLYVLCRYDQAKMRTHLIECFRAQKMKKFPSREIHPQRKPLAQKIVSVLCVCRLPLYLEEGMIVCCKCKKCYHIVCVMSKQPSTDWTCCLHVHENKVKTFYVFISVMYMQ